MPKKTSKISDPVVTTSPTDSVADPAPSVPATTPAAANEALAAPRQRRRPRTASSSSTLDQAQAVCAALREALDKSRELVRAIKRHKRQRQLVESTLASLKQLQSVA